MKSNFQAYYLKSVRSYCYQRNMSENCELYWKYLKEPWATCLTSLQQAIENEAQFLEIL